MTISLTPRLLERVQEYVYDQTHDRPGAIHPEDEPDPLGRAQASANMKEARRARIVGELLDTHDAFATEAVRRELIRRRIDPDAPPRIVAGTDMPGRWPGVETRGVRSDLPVMLPVPYVRGVTSAAWEISGPVIEKMRRQFPNGRPFAAEKLIKWRELSALIVTPGDIYREALVRQLRRKPRPATTP